MTRYIEMACPRCSRDLRIRSEYLGQSVICNHCDSRFEVALPGVSTESEPSGPIVDRLAALEHALLDAEAARRAFEQERIDLSRQLQDARADCERWRKEFDDLRAQAERNERLAAESEALRDDLADARVRLDALGDEVRTARLRAAEACAERDRIEAERDALQRELERAWEDLAGARSDLDRADVLASSARDEVVRALDTERNLRDAERAEFEAIRTRLRDQAGVTTRELGLAVEERDDLKARCVRLENELAIREARENQLREECGALTKDLDRAQTLARHQADQNDTLRDQNRRLEAELEGRGREEETERQEHERLIAELQRELDEHRNAWRQDLEQSELALRASRAESESLAAERDAALAKAQLLDRTREEVTKRLEAAERRSRESQSSLQADLERLATVLDDCRRDRDEAVQLASDLARQAAELQSELDRLGPSGRTDDEGDLAALEPESGSGNRRESLPAPITGDNSSQDVLGPLSPAEEEVVALPMNSKRGVATAKSLSRGLPIQREVHWYMEMNRRIAELHRKRRR